VQISGQKLSGWSGNFIRLFAIGLAALVWGVGLAETTDQAATAAEAPQGLADDVRIELDDMLSLIEANRNEIKQLNVRADKAEGLSKELLLIRADRLWLDTGSLAYKFATDVADLRDDNYDISPYEPAIRRMLSNLPEKVQYTVNHILTKTKIPDAAGSAAEQAVADEHFFSTVGEITDTYQKLIDGLDIAVRFDLEIEPIIALLRERVVDVASTTSVFLDFAEAEQAGVKAAVSAMPDDAELAGLLTIADRRVERTADVLDRQVGIMEHLDLPVTRFKKQLLASTGSLSASNADAEVLFGLLGSWWESFVASIGDYGPGILLNILLFMIILFLAFKAAGGVQSLVDHALKASGASVSVLLRNMLLSVSRNIVIALGVLIALSQVGISLGPVLAGLGIAGFIVGFALQDTLSNFASGLLILFYRPFDVGDTVEVAGVGGQVNRMSLVNTTVLTFDNQSLIVPNNKIWQGVIKNVTAQTRRRVDLVYSVSYDSDLDRVIELLLELVKADERVLESPEPVVKVSAFSESSIDLLCRPWVKTTDYWGVLWDLNRSVKQAFDSAGIAMPFPQRDVHIVNTSTPDSQSEDGGKQAEE